MNVHVHTCTSTARFPRLLAQIVKQKKQLRADKKAPPKQPADILVVNDETTVADDEIVRDESLAATSIPKQYFETQKGTCGLSIAFGYS